jgi:hypothetical protein
MSMMDGLVKITSEELDKYICACDEFMLIDPCIYGLDIYLQKSDLSIVAYQDPNGDCFSRTCYWRIS